MSGEKILVVDDEAKIRDVLGHFLESAGYVPLVTGDPEEALVLARREAPHLALIDIMMPAMDGFDLCQMIRDHLETKDIPVVFVTAVGDDVSRARGRVSGGMLHVQKPFRKEDILNAVAEGLKARAPKSPRSRKGWAKAVSLDALRDARRTEGSA